MKLATILAALLALSGLTTMAWAAGIDLLALGNLPWWEIALAALPVLGVGLFRLTTRS